MLAWIPTEDWRAEMASIRKEVLIEASADDVWAALRDWSAPHERLVPGFVVDTLLDARASSGSRTSCRTISPATSTG